MEPIVRSTQLIRGHPFPDNPWCLKKNIEEALDYPPRNGDIIVASFPRTGTNWLKYIVMQIVSKGENFPKMDDVVIKCFPYMEYVGAQVLDTLKNPRMYQHHCPYNLVQKNPNAKVLYIYRHPEDVLVSLYSFWEEIYGSDVELEKFFDDFLMGTLEFGSYFKNILSFLEHHQDENLLFISYEKMLSNKRETILRIASFLGDEYHKLLLEDNSLLEKVMERTTFEYMKKNLVFDIFEMRNIDGMMRTQARSVNFFRKGKVGTGKIFLSDEKRQRLKDKAEELLKGTTVYNDWYPD